MLRGNSQCIVLPGQQAIEGELDFEHFPGRDVSQVDALDARVGAEHVDAETVANQHADHWIFKVALRDGPHANGDRLMRFEISDGLATRINKVRTEDLACAVAMAKTRSGLRQVATRLFALL